MDKKKKTLIKILKSFLENEKEREKKIKNLEDISSLSFQEKEINNLKKLIEDNIELLHSPELKQLIEEIYSQTYSNQKLIHFFSSLLEENMRYIKDNKEKKNKNLILDIKL